MKTCVYYELEQVSEEDVRRARALAGSDALEVVPFGTLWPTAMCDRQPTRAVTHRDPRFLGTVMPWVDQVGKSLEQNAPDIAWRHGVSLAEAARFDLLFSVAEAIQRWSVLATIRERWNPDRLIWYTARAWPDPELTALRQSAGKIQIQVHRAAPSRRSFWNSTRNAIKLRFGPPIKRIGRIARAAFGPAQWPQDRCEVVFTEYFPHNVHALMPVARRLETEHGIKVRWLAARQKVADALAAQGLECVRLPQSLSAGAHWRGRLNASQRRSLKRALERLPAESLLWSSARDSREYLLSVLKRRLVTAWDENARWIEFYSEAWQTLHPGVIVSATYSNGMGRVAAMTAKLHGACAAYLQHGVLPAVPAFAWFSNDLLMVWGEWNRRNLVSYGVDDRLICVTGPTIYDAMLREATGAPSRPMPRPGEPFKIAYMASRTAGSVVTYAEARATLIAVAGAVRGLPGGHLTVKTHPGDDTGMAADVLRDFPEFKVVREGPARDIILASDAVIVVSSTTGLEACAAGKPLILLNLANSPATVPYAEYGAALCVSPEASDATLELERTLSDLQRDPTIAISLAEGRRELLMDLLNGGKGDAAAAAAVAVTRLLGQRNGPKLNDVSEPVASRGTT